MKSLDSIDSFIISGTTAILKVNSDSEVDKNDLKKAFKSQGLRLKSLETREINKPTVAYEMSTKGTG